MLLSCDAMAVKGQKEISEESAESLGLVPGGSVLAGGTQDGDASDGSSPAASDGGPPAPAAQPAAAANPDYRYWQPYLPLNVKWAHLGLTEPNASELDRLSTEVNIKCHKFQPSFGGANWREPEGWSCRPL